MVILAGILLVLAVVALVVSPLVRGLQAPLTDGPDRLAALRELYALRDVTYETLRDLEFDFQSGKISEADYKELGDRYRADRSWGTLLSEGVASLAPGLPLRPLWRPHMACGGRRSCPPRSFGR